MRLHLVAGELPAECVIEGGCWVWMAKRSKGCAGEHIFLVICLGSFAQDALRREVVFNSAVYLALASAGQSPPRVRCAHCWLAGLTAPTDL